MSEYNRCSVCGNLFDYIHEDEVYRKYSIMEEVGWDEGDWERYDTKEDLCLDCWLKVKALLNTIKGAKKNG